MLLLNLGNGQRHSVRSIWRAATQRRGGAFHGGSEDKESGFDPWVGMIPWRREWQPTPVFLHGEFHGQRNLAGYSPWGHKELDTTEQLTHTQHWVGGRVDT